MSAQDRRVAVRITTSIEVKYSSDSPPIVGRLSDVSESGIYVDTTPVQPLPPGSTVEFILFLPDELPDEPIRGAGRVIWNDQAGMGIEFHDLSPKVRDRIKFFVAQEFFAKDSDDSS